MNSSDIVSIICSILGVVLAIISVGVTIFIYNRQTKLEKDINQKDEKKYKLQIQSEARQFVQKYNENNEIQLLAFCIIADKYDTSFPYRRQIYKDYCSLNDDVKKELVSIVGIDKGILDLPANEFYNNTLNKGEKIINNYLKNNPNFFSNHFYDDAKYFEHSLTIQKAAEVPNYILKKRKSMFGDLNYSFKDLITSVLAKQDIEIELVDGKIINPRDVNIEELFTIETENGNALNGDEIVMNYLCTEILLYSAVYYNRSHELFSDCGYYSDYFLSNTMYMEDLFLETLLEINNRFICK